MKDLKHLYYLLFAIMFGVPFLIVHFDISGPAETIIGILCFILLVIIIRAIEKGRDLF